MEWITVTAPSISEAKEQLLDKLGVPDGEAEFVVEDEGESKFFGLKKTDARVRARVVPRQTEDRRDRKRSRPDRGRNAKGSGGRGKGRNGKSGDSGSDRKASKSGTKASGDQDAPKQVNVNESDLAATNGGDKSQKSDGARKQKARSNRDRPKVEKVEIPMEQVQANLTGFLDGLTSAFGIDAKTELTVEDEYITANVAGQHGVLVGPKARTLDAIQELAKIASFRGGASPARVKVDVGDYRKKRAIALGEFGVKAAQKAIDEGTEVVLDPMSSADRKVVHDALSDIEGIETRSVGTDPRRQVVIAPLPQ